jgi:hypothetical protein
MSDMKYIAIVDDHSMFRKGLSIPVARHLRAAPRIIRMSMTVDVIPPEDIL